MFAPLNIKLKSVSMGAARSARVSGLKAWYPDRIQYYNGVLLPSFWMIPTVVKVFVEPQLGTLSPKGLSGISW